MASRLDRLFVLLESGSSSGTRRAAAQQLGQVQRLHPHELPQLLSRVHKCLKSTSWETRVAAGQAVEAILSQIPVWEPEQQSPVDTPDHDVKIKIEGDGSDVHVSSGKKSTFKFSTFKVDEIINDPMAPFLMSSEEKVFDREMGIGQSGAAQQDPTRQRQQLNKRLGLDIAEKIGIDTSEIVSNEDFEQTPAPVSIKTPTLSRSNSSFDEMSTREINLAKRRARKQKSINENLSNNDSQGQGQSQGPSEAKKLKKEESFDYAAEHIGSSVNFYDKAIEEGRWPLDEWTNLLAEDLFSPLWEVRHGAGIALREVVKIHGKSAGKINGLNPIELETMHQEWLEDFSLRLLRVLALDRFGDFVSDQVVAPVRETVSQCLGTVLTLMSSQNVSSLLQILLTFLDQRAWEIRHGALLAMKYLFAVRNDLVPNLLPSAFPSIFLSLSDPVDDVCAVAASAFIPVVEDLVKILPTESPKVVNVLWDSLANLDDLSSACNSIMGLLANLLAYPAARSNLRCLDILIPRLWPFLHHTSSSVRKSALLTLQKLSELDPTVAPMSVEPLQLTLRHTFQRALLESMPEVLELIPQVWSNILKSAQLQNLLLAACPMIGQWLFLNMQHPRLAIDPQYLIPIHEKGHVGKSSVSDSTSSDQLVFEKVFLSGSADSNHLKVANTRFTLSKMIGMLIPYIVRPLPPGTIGEPPVECFARLVLYHLNTRSALQRTVSALVISAWEKPPTTPTPNGNSISIADNSHQSHPGLATRFLECLAEHIFYDEIAYSVTKLQSECRDFLSTLKHYKVPLGPEWEGLGVLSFDQIDLLTNSDAFSIEIIQKTVKKAKILESLIDRRKGINNLCLSTRTELSALTTTTQAALAGAVVSLNALPQKLHPIVKPLMDSIRYETNELFQKNSSFHLCNLMNIVLSRSPSPVDKIIQNLTSFLCSDGDFTPPIDFESGILALQQLSEVKITALKTDAEETTKKPSKQPVISAIQRRGATYALSCIVKYFGAELPVKISRLWDLTFGVLETQTCDSIEDRPEELRKVIDALQILEIISIDFHPGLFSTIEAQIGRTCELLGHQCRAIRHMASRCLAVWSALIPETVMPVVAREIVPKLNGNETDLMRQGAIESIWCIIDKLGLDLLPYIVLLVVPVLGRMSDQDESVRMLASLTFATLVRLMPLEGGVPDPPCLPPELLQQKSEQRLFLEQLLCPTKIPEYKISVPIKTTLRPYQQAGVNWLGFLNQYKLHGILCDDMGLGKTIQSICILGSDHFNNNGNVGANSNPPSIVICPPTLTGHWVYEIEQFIEKEYLNPLHYHGPPAERNKLKPKLSSHNLVVVSYDIVRNDVDFFSSIRWNYCILDEGHMIKNGRTKISKAIKQLKANHRLILSGTPIQNNVLELWSLFDFLMPGFLGTEKQFSARFGRPILLARDPKSSPKDQEAGALAMEALHRQALPFLLRRLKEDVLQDLPPKITQDYYCELSSIQEQLYEDFARTRAHQSLRDNLSSSTQKSNEESIKHSHIFQALQYLRKVCNHPKLVLTPQHPKYGSVMKQLSTAKTNLNDIQHSAKLPALKQLLLDCGIGVERGDDGIDVVNQHRALIFCQLKVMLDILENDLFKIHMPSVTYLRLDGSVPAGQRHSLVTRFNNDPSIDVLLLTTQVGGLGLNLTGADTVIFVEHDWNPMRDLQAMDRAHRIGQKKVVNVYRLITQGTLEEKIMGLQKFKLMTANTVISQDNSCIETMATDQLLDLFVLEDSEQKSKSKSSSKSEDVGGIVGAYKNVLENIPDLWDDKLYDEEYDLSTFIKNLSK